MQTLLCVSTGIRMWALNGYNLVDGYPKYIHKLGLPKTIRKIDAAVYIRDTGKTLLFTDEDYWRYVVMSITLKFKINPLNLKKTSTTGDQSRLSLLLFTQLR